MPFILHISDDGQTCPYFRCDLCGKLITEASQGLLVWHHDKYKEKIFEPFIVCTSLCEQNVKSRFDASIELDTALIYLFNNSGMTGDRIKEAREKARLLSEL